MTESQLKHFAIRLLSQIFVKHLQKSFATWSTMVILIKSSNKRKTLVLKITSESPPERPEKLPRSPTSTTNRLYELSKTQQKKRESLISQVLPKYSFSPKVNSSNDKRRSLQQMKPITTEPLAIVSACSVSMSLQSTFNRSLTPNF